MTFKNRLSPEGKKKCAESGAPNLALWHELNDARANQLEADAEAFRKSLLAECGPNPSQSRVALIEACTTSYASIIRLRRVIIRARKGDVVTLSERASWLASGLVRLLKQLNLDARPRPRTLADLMMQRTPENEQNSAAKPTKCEATPNV